MLLGLALVFGSAFFLVKLALGSYGPLTVALTRVALGCLILGTVAVWRGGALPRGPRIWLALLVMGALNNAIPFALISWGQTHIESGLAAILNAMTPIFTVLAAHAAGQERLSLRRLAGVALGFLGVAVLIGPASLRHLDLTNLAEIAVLLAAVSYAAASIWGRRLRELPVEVAAAGMLGSSTLLLLPGALLLEHPWRISPTPLASPLWRRWGALAPRWPICSISGCCARVGATNLPLVTFLLPIVALILGAVFLGEHIETAICWGSP